jgi:hypothetical protein
MAFQEVGNGSHFLFISFFKEFAQKFVHLEAAGSILQRFE